MNTSSRMTAKSSLSSSRKASRPEVAVTTSASGFEHFGQREQVALVVVDQQDSRARRHRRPRFSGDRTSGDMVAGACSRGRLHRCGEVGLGFSPTDPHSQQGEQQVDVDGLGDVVGSAGVEALLPVALHRLGGHRDQRMLDSLGLALIRCIVS
jgi:hypothetical protein